MKRQKGFTLIELLIVIGIIAILAAAVIIAINPGRQFAQARQSTRQSHVASIANAFYAYAIDWGGEFPTDCPAETETTDLDATACGVITPTYMQEFPEDPQGGQYKVELVGTRLKVSAPTAELEETISITQ